MPDAPLRALAFMTAAAVFFAVMNAVARTLSRLPFPLVACTRAAFGLAVAFALARARGISLVVHDRRTMRRRSVSGSLSMLCTFYALTHMPLADATALLNTTPLWIAGLAAVTLRERVSPRTKAALLLAAVGVALIERPGLREGALAGVLALVAAALSAVSMVSLRRLSGETPEAVVVHFSAVAMGFLLGVTGAWALANGTPPTPTTDDLARLVVMGATGTAGQLCITRAYALDKAARVGAAGGLQILLALAIDVMVFRRLPEGMALAGIALLLVGGALLVDDARRDAARTSVPAVRA